MNMDKNLVANRECGECRACCVYPAIDSDEFVKLSNVNCENLLANGKCNIYANRPSTCSEFFCAWRKMSELDDSWRPDKLGILVEISNENFPNMFSGRIGFRFRILDKEKLFSNDKFIKFVARQVRDWVPCVLTYGINPAQVAVSVFLNISLQEAVSKKDHKMIKEKLIAALETCENLPEEKMRIENGKLISIATENQ
jgi:uncharacterized cysteine cluster protein YcgN (CxxCxxCC family)